MKCIHLLNEYASGPNICCNLLKLFTMSRAYFGPYHENKVLQMSEIWSIFEGSMIFLSKTSIRTSYHIFCKLMKKGKGVGVGGGVSGQIWTKSYQALST